MILVDSSCWVEFYKPDGNAEVREAVLEALRSGRAAVCAMIRVEILGYIKGKREFDIVSRDFDALTCIETGAAEVDAAVHAGRCLRAKGATVPPSDLLIAGVAMANDAVVLHSDADFVRVAAHCPELRQQLVAT